MDAYKALASSYDRLTSDVDYKALVDFYWEILRREKVSPRTAVDLACGTGSVTELLCKKGLKTIGVDLSEDMLTQAQQKTAGLENRPMFICQPLQRLRLRRGWTWPCAPWIAWTTSQSRRTAVRPFFGSTGP